MPVLLMFLAGAENRGQNTQQAELTPHYMAERNNI
jgi:hypothetical protein